MSTCKPHQPFIVGRTELNLKGHAMSVASIHRSGPKAPVVFLHGFGSSKEDYADLVHQPSFADRAFLAYDAPGFGASEAERLEEMSIPVLVEVAKAMLERFGVRRFHLAGHSMGGLTALLLAHELGDRVLSFANIEGNVAPEDCFLSRQVVTHAHPDPGAFLDAFIERARRAPAYASALYAAGLRSKVQAGAAPGIFASMVQLSDHGGLMQRFLGLACPCMFMYGSQNASLSYLGHLDANGVRLAEIPESGHFPMYSNPPAMWSALARFVSDAEAAQP